MKLPAAASALWLLWSFGAVLYAGGRGGIAVWRWGLTLALLAGALGLGAMLWRRTAVPGGPGLLWAGLLACGLPGLVLFLWQRPGQDRQWSSDQTRVTRVERAGDALRFSDVRNFRYRSTTDWDEAWEDRDYRLSELARAWFAVERFGGFEGAAHTFVTFEFATAEGPRYLSVSIEIRKESGEEFALLPALYRQYELHYVVGDERDIIELRTNHRDDQVFLFPIDRPPERLQSFLLDMVERINQLADEPEFYNLATSTCTTNLVDHFEAVSGEKVPFDPRVWMPGRSGELAWELGLVSGEGSFESIRAAADITGRARAARGDDFSAAIRR